MTLYLDVGPIWASVVFFSEMSPPRTVNFNLFFYQISTKNDIYSFQDISLNCFNTRVFCSCWVPVYFINYTVSKWWVFTYQWPTKCAWADIFHDFSHFTSFLDQSDKIGKIPLHYNVPFFMKGRTAVVILFLIINRNWCVNKIMLSFFLDAHDFSLLMLFISFTALTLVSVEDVTTCIFNFFKNL